MDITLLYFFIYIVEALILQWYLSNIFSSEYPAKIRYSSLITGYVLLFLLSLIKQPIINIASFFLVNLLILLLIYKVKLSVGIFHSLMLTCLMILSEIIVVGLFSQSSESSILLDPSITFLIILTLFCKSLYFIILSIVSIPIKKYLGNANKIYTNRITAFLNFIPLISLYIVITLTGILLTTSIPMHFKRMLSLCCALLVIINVLTFYIYNYTQQKNKEFTDIQLQLQKENDMTEYYKTLITQSENQKILIHDIRNHLSSIARLNDKKEYDKVKQYLVDLLNSSDLQKSVHYSDNELLNSILCHYMNLCKNNNIAFRTDIRAKLLHNFEYTDLTALFCNLLDNAINSCTDLPDSYIELSITGKEKLNLTIINIVNSCRFAPTFDKNGLPHSTKMNKNKHGIGLKSVCRVVDKYYGNIKMYYDDDKKSFHTIIAIQDCSSNYYVK